MTLLQGTDQDSVAPNSQVTEEKSEDRVLARDPEMTRDHSDHSGLAMVLLHLSTGDPSLTEMERSTETTEMASLSDPETSTLTSMTETYPESLDLSAMTESLAMAESLAEAEELESEEA